MTDRSPHSDRGDEATGSGIRRWVQIVGIVAAVVILLVLAMMLVAGPGGHTPPVSH